MNPETLYNICLSAIRCHYHILKSEVENLSGNVRFDIYYQIFTEQRFCLLGMELNDLGTMGCLLKLSSKRVKLLQIFQAAIEHGVPLAKDISVSYVALCNCLAPAGLQTKANIIEFGLRLGGFLIECGWLGDAERVLIACQNVCATCESTPYFLTKLLDCCHKLLQAQSTFCHFEGAQATQSLALNTVNKLAALGEPVNIAGLYSQFSILHFNRSEYNDAYKWSVEAIKRLDSSLPTRVVIDIIRQASKSCVVKRDFKRAALLAKQALAMVKETCGIYHPKTADVLIDYGFYLLNHDSYLASVDLYRTALNIRLQIFGKLNLYVAAAHEDLSYALYVHEYSSGRFIQARDHAEEALEIMSKILPENHLKLASVKRVKALILEEIALDTAGNNATVIAELLESAENLHMSALHLTMAAFGEKNVQTAKHFGNLGRLYQSMKKYQEAETMHLRAISIKEELLGPEDYEVGLSLGHLASLYNYHMKKHKKAERLYLKSIDISLRLFGPTYSGLVYDYRGLVFVYNELQDPEKVAEYTLLMNTWNLNRELHEEEPNPLTLDDCSLPIQTLISSFATLV